MDRRDEIQNLNEAMREAANKRLYERYLAVRLHLEGHTFTEIGNSLIVLIKLLVGIGLPTGKTDSKD